MKLPRMLTKHRNSKYNWNFADQLPLPCKFYDRCMQGISFFFFFFFFFFFIFASREACKGNGMLLQKWSGFGNCEVIKIDLNAVDNLMWNMLIAVSYQVFFFKYVCEGCVGKLCYFKLWSSVFKQRGWLEITFIYLILLWLKGVLKILILETMESSRQTSFSSQISSFHRNNESSRQTSFYSSQTCLFKLHADEVLTKNWILDLYLYIYIFPPYRFSNVIIFKEIQRNFTRFGCYFVQ